MVGFEALYKQKVTLFQRFPVSSCSVADVAVADIAVVDEDYYEGDDSMICWVPVLLDGVHLMIDRSIIISTYGEQASDNAMLNVRYAKSGEDAIIGGLRYCKPKEWMMLESFDDAISFKFGDEFDFFIEGDYTELGVVFDDDYRNGFYNHMNRNYDNVFAITAVSKYNLLPHFGITAR
mgnify:CR=1 FL=1